MINDGPNYGARGVHKLSRVIRVQGYTQYGTCMGMCVTEKERVCVDPIKIGLPKILLEQDGSTALTLQAVLS